MKNLFILTLLVSTISLFASPSFAVKLKCKVQSIAGTTVVFDCGKKAKRLKAGTSVTITSKKKDGDGC